jgi:hypothetical protein
MLFPGKIILGHVTLRVGWEHSISPGSLPWKDLGVLTLAGAGQDSRPEELP